jgi:hypothetical protein
LRDEDTHGEEAIDSAEKEGFFGRRQVQVLENRQVRKRVLREAPPEDHEEGEVAASPPCRREVKAKMAKTRRGKKIVHVPAHRRTVRTKKGRRRVRIPEHYRSTPE